MGSLAPAGTVAGAHCLQGVGWFGHGALNVVDGELQLAGCRVAAGHAGHRRQIGEARKPFLELVVEAVVGMTRLQLEDEQRSWLRQLRMVRQISTFTVVHSTLDQPSNWNYVTNRFDAMASFSYQFTQLCFHGHTHVPRVFVKTDKVAEVPADSIAIEKNAKYFINVGSVGQPRDGDWRACYAIFDLDHQLVVFRRVEYDLGATQNKIIAAGLPLMLAERLAEGR